MTAPMPPFQPLNLTQIGEESARLLKEFSEKHGVAPHMGTYGSVTKAFMELAERMMRNPEKLIQMQLDLYQQYLGLWANMAERMMGKAPQPLITPESGDRRFKDDEWQQNMIFDYIKQSYLLASRWMLTNVRSVEGELDKPTAEKVDFYTRQFIDALAPTNFPLTNPEVIRKTIETNGQNLVKGLQNLLTDLERGGGKFVKIKTTDVSAFEVGKNIAATEGAVVFRNRMFELIQYTPKTPKVHARPLVILPPWINKFYILDMRPENSFIRYAVEECGLTVFVVSWKNPDASYRDVGFDTYMKEGALEAVAQALAITGEKDVNMIGYCIGGTMLAATLAYMVRKKDKRVHSATFFTTLMDFTEAGELGVFIDEEQVEALEERMQERGYLEGSEMAQTFSMLRANDMVWSFVVNNYLLGQDPFPFDLLYWNEDSTRMPYAMHSFYLRNMYLENNLAKPDKLTLLGEKIDIHQIETPIYMVSAKGDHITPWTSCFRPLPSLKSDVRFILGNSGHVAGVVNPPAKAKGYYWAGAVKAGETADTWLAKQKQTDGSWWPDWKAWIKGNSGAEVAARKPGGPKNPVIEAAPGSYVREKA